ncbi:PI-PLC X domain-containing protein At5g67130-like [Tripterygium wilfordii]|uniref:PI-PLC X domain-containing protein At5g67130-like n=1 Tax=Tripterygium wilfordii TaxID=458696 RepID=UPI0018F83B1C|nr:PI-PLC X domain-containing protein At5g67130-like [Tripterygium wilfordii]
MLYIPLQKFVPVAVLVALLFFFSVSSSLRIVTVSGFLHCETCVANGNLRPRCTQIRPLNPILQVKGLPFNRYSWLTTRTMPLRGWNGVRGLMLDMYDFLNGIWFVTLLEVNTSTLQLSPELVDCLLCMPASQQPAINVLREIQQFLEANPTEIVTIIIEDYVSSPVPIVRVCQFPLEETDQSV